MQVEGVNLVGPQRLQTFQQPRLEAVFPSLSKPTEQLFGKEAISWR